MLIFSNELLSVEFRDDILQIFYSFRQDSIEKYEAGGILMGRRLINGDIFITDVTSPQKGDTRKRSFFKKQTKIHQSISDSLWEKSSGMTVYLGEWHTHPEDSPIPSPIDLRGWKLSVSKQPNDKTYIFVILGIKELSVWSYSKTDGLIKMKQKTRENNLND